MKDRLRKKLIAGVLLSTFSLMGLPTVSTAQDGYYGYETLSRPELRTMSDVSINLEEGSKISNGDSVVNLSLRDADITQVLRMFADQAGMNIIFADGIENTVTMDLVNINLASAFEMVIKTNKLYYYIEDNTILVSKDPSGISSLSTSMVIIPVKYVSAVSLAYFIDTQIFGLSASSGSGGGSDDVNPQLPGKIRRGVVVTNPALNELIVTASPQDIALIKRIVAQFDKKPTITTIKVNHTTPEAMASAVCDNFIQSTMTPYIGGEASGSSSGGAAGIATGFASDSGGSSGGPESITVGGAKLACTSVGALTADNENEEKKQSFSSIPTMNFSVSYFPTQGTIQIIGGSESQIEMIKEYIALNDKKAPQAYLEVQIVELNESGSKEFNNSWQFLSHNFSFNATAGQFQSNPFFPIFFAGQGFHVLDQSWSEEGGKYGSWGIKEGYTKYVGSPTLSYAVNYMLRNGKARTLANPKIIVTSGQTATIDLSSEYIDTVKTEFNSNNIGVTGIATRTYNKGSDNGIQISVVPFISPDGYVVLDIDPQYQSILDTVTEISPNGSVDTVATLLNKRNLSIRGVRIKDGETLVLGGLIQEVEKKTVSKIPFLGDIPVVGMFFRSSKADREKEELVIMITPQIIVDTEDSFANDDAEMI